MTLPTSTIVCILFVYTGAFGEVTSHNNIDKTTCVNEVLRLNCSEDAVVVATIYGGHHMDKSTNCSYLAGDCVAPIKGFHMLKVEESLWKKSILEITLSFLLFDDLCSKYFEVHYVLAENFTCVPRKDVHMLSAENTTTNSTSGYLLTPGYPMAYPRDGARYQVTVERRTGYRVFLRSVHMNVRPVVDGECSDHVKVSCSTGNMKEMFCGSEAWQVSADGCSGDVIITLVTTQHEKLYSGFVVAFNYVQPLEVPVETTPVFNDGWTFVPWMALTVTSLTPPVILLLQTRHTINALHSPRMNEPFIYLH